jgi:signal transduction histidine kinase
MRYISHEIRTPLNIVLSGLKVLEDDIARNVPQAELTETVLDIRGSCVIAVETLSEMLTYDKVESKSMALDMSDFGVQSFVTECLRPFYLQVMCLVCQSPFV